MTEEDGSVDIGVKQRNEKQNNEKMLRKWMRRVRKRRSGNGEVRNLERQANHRPRLSKAPAT